MRNFIGLAVALMMVSGAAMAQEARPRLSEACRAEVINLCPKSEDRTARRACMMEKRASISEMCRSEIMAARAARKAPKSVPAPMTAPPPVQ